MSVVDLFGSRRDANRAEYGRDPFAQFWRLYPRKVAKQEALLAWRCLSPADQTRALEQIAAHVAHWHDHEIQDRFIPHAATWLRGRRFDDELAGAQGREERLRAYFEGHS